MDLHFIPHIEKMYEIEEAAHRYRHHDGQLASNASPELKESFDAAAHTLAGIAATINVADLRRKFFRMEALLAVYSLEHDETLLVGIRDEGDTTVVYDMERHIELKRIQYHAKINRNCDFHKVAVEVAIATGRSLAGWTYPDHGKTMHATLRKRIKDES